MKRYVLSNRSASGQGNKPIIELIPVARLAAQVVLVELPGVVQLALAALVGQSPYARGPLESPPAVIVQWSLMGQPEHRIEFPRLWHQR